MLMFKPIKIKSKIKKVAAVIIVVMMSAAVLASCSDDGDRVGFSPMTGSYEIMLAENDWMFLDVNTTWEMQLLHNNPDNPNFVLQVDYYSRNYIASQSAPDFESFISFFRSLDTIREMYEAEHSNVHELQEVHSRYIRGSVRSAKRQQISMDGPEHSFIF